MKLTFYKFLSAFFFLVCIQLQPTVLLAQTDEPVYEFADEMPQSKIDYTQFIANNLKYPKEALDNNIQGTVYAEIIVNKLGKITTVNIRKDIGGGCGKEVQRVLMEMPAWSPGKQNGRPVSVKMTIPVKFVLHNSDKKQKDKDEE